MIPTFRPEKPHPPLRRIFDAALATAFFSTVYLVTNHFPLFPPKELTMTALDSWMPLWPGASWIYLSVFGMAYFPFIFIQDGGVHRRYRLAFLLMVLLCGTVFVLYPTVYPRATYPVEAGAGLSGMLLDLFRKVDAPTNCAPSLHVGVAYLAAMPFLDRGRARAGLFLVWATAVWISTLLTKQHFWIDGVLGFVVASASFYLAGVIDLKRARSKTRKR